MLLVTHISNPQSVVLQICLKQVLEPCSNEKLLEIPVSYERMFPYGRCFCLLLSLRNANLQAKVNMRKAAQEEAVVLDQGLEDEILVDIQKYLEDLINSGLRQRLISLIKEVNREEPSGLRLKPEEAVQATIYSLPDEVVDTVSISSLPAEDFVS
ncbi:hypothetical protein RIF29_38107 [Crotalaria pallida]|uniref:Uncharacterized protein n=1 Tax=Crotalaria pallida TaxID=3830 RepID=A0AAN9HNG8_CROPI